MTTDWRAAGWYLERRHAERWQRRQSMAIAEAAPEERRELIIDDLEDPEVREASAELRSRIEARRAGADRQSHEE